jgi:hypothetical protein
MHPSTEALLTLRDGEPIDAALRDDLLADPEAVIELDRLSRMREALRELPDIDPTGDAWSRVAAELDRDDAQRARKPLRWAAGAAIAAAAATGAIVYLMQLPGGPLDAPSSTVAADPTSVTAEPPRVMAVPFAPPSYVALVEESARLERVLARIPHERRMMTAHTAGTIVGLEDRIAYIDEQLALGTAYDMGFPEREALWGQRVELMKGLVYVRYAQAQRTGF